MGLFDIFGYIGGLINSLVQALSQAFLFLWNALQSLFAFLWQNLLNVAQLLGNQLRKVARFLQRFWTDYVLKGIRGLAQIFERLRARIQAIVDPVLKLIRRIRDWYDHFVLPWQLKAINLIQRIRMTLTVFRFFHVKWAIALDNKLARIQGKIVDSIQIIRGKLNEIASVLELIVDPALIIRRDVWLGSFFNGLDGTFRAIFGHSVVSALKRGKTPSAETINAIDGRAERSALIGAVTGDRSAYGLAGDQAREAFQTTWTNGQTSN